MVDRMKHAVVRAAKKADNRWTFMIALAWLGIVVAQIVSSAGTPVLTPTSAYCVDPHEEHTELLEVTPKGGKYVAAD